MKFLVLLAGLRLTAWASNHQFVVFIYLCFYEENNLSLFEHSELDHNWQIATNQDSSAPSHTTNWWFGTMELYLIPFYRHREDMIGQWQMMSWSVSWQLFHPLPRLQYRFWIADAQKNNVRRILFCAAKQGCYARTSAGVQKMMNARINKVNVTMITAILRMKRMMMCEIRYGKRP